MRTKDYCRNIFRAAVTMAANAANVWSTVYPVVVFSSKAVVGSINETVELLQV